VVLFEDRVIPIGERLKPPAEAAGPIASQPVPERVDAAIIGGGIIGLSIGWRLAARGMTVAVFDRALAGAGTTLAATGMLAAAAEHEPGGEALLPFALDSQRRWPAFRDALEADSGIGIDYRAEGTLVAAQNRDEVARLRFRYDHQQRSGLRVEWLNGTEARRREPGLRASVAGGIFCPDDHQVDPRLIVPALVRALRKRGGHLIENATVTGIEASAGRATGVTTQNGVCHAGTVVLAAGVWSADLLRPHGIDIPLRPLRGQALALRTTRQTGTLSHIVWTEQIHLAPKGDGRLIVGATMEETGFNSAVTAGGMLALLEGVHRIFPSSEEMEIEAIWSGFRPTTDDDAPILGNTPLPGLLIATGHHRNGILLAPGTAAAIEEMVTTGRAMETTAALELGRLLRPSPIPHVTGATACN